MMISMLMAAEGLVPFAVYIIAESIGSGEIILRFKIPAGRAAVKKSQEKTAVPVNDADRRSVRLLFSGDDDHFRDAVIKAGFFRRDAADPAGPAVSVIRFPGR